MTRFELAQQLMHIGVSANEGYEITVIVHTRELDGYVTSALSSTLESRSATRALFAELLVLMVQADGGSVENVSEIVVQDMLTTGRKIGVGDA